MKDCALGIIWNQDKSEVLLIKRRDVAVWVLPGGGIDPDESPESAVVREVLEETGLHVTIQYKAAEYTAINRWTRRTHLFVCEPLSGTCMTGDETVAIQFYPLHAPPSPFFDFHQKWLHEIVKARQLPIQKPMSRYTFWRLVFKAFLRYPHLAFRYIIARCGFPINS